MEIRLFKERRRMKKKKERSMEENTVKGKIKN